MHRSRTALSAIALAAAVTACGAQSATNSTAALGARGTTTAPTSAAARTAPATRTAAASTRSAGTTSAAATTTAAAASTPAATAPATTAVPTLATSPAAPTTSADASKVSAGPLATVTIADSSVRPHFTTPEAAMRYLAAAWNANDMTALKHVTQGTARMLLMGMKTEAVNLRLDHCELRDGGNGDYLCHFVHDYPKSYPAKLRQGAHGTSEFIAAPSASVGWYMYAYEGCG